MKKRKKPEPLTQEGQLRLSPLAGQSRGDAVLNEVRLILERISPPVNADGIAWHFTNIAHVYEGCAAGYQACNTEYHDLCHVHDVFLAMARMAHGAAETGAVFESRQVELGLIAALYHDVGYIQHEDDQDGTGSKYTAEHVRRGMYFVERHSRELGLLPEEVREIQAMILLTDLNISVQEVEFSCRAAALLGRCLGAADLIAQMADRAYLEKLLFLYYEFREAGVGNYADEVDLLRKTLGFYGYVENRLSGMLPEADRLLEAHFAARWGLSENLYRTSLENQRRYLERILTISGSDPRDFLRRNGIVEQVRSRYSTLGWGQED